MSDSDYPFDDAKKFWEWYNREIRDNEYPFGGEIDRDEQPQIEGFEPDSDFDGMANLLDADADHFDPLTGLPAELASTAYTIEEMESAVNYVKDAPPGILKLWITEGGVIEIYRYASA